MDFFFADKEILGFIERYAHTLDMQSSTLESIPNPIEAYLEG